jgi:hypothetical protein
MNVSDHSKSQSSVVEQDIYADYKQIVTQPQGLACMKEIFQDDYDRLKQASSKSSEKLSYADSIQDLDFEQPRDEVSTFTLTDSLNSLSTSEILTIFRKLDLKHQNAILSTYFTSVLSKFPFQ